MVRTFDTCIFACMAALVLSVPLRTAEGGTFKVLYSFAGRADGGEPGSGAVLLDKRGNLYGTTVLINASGAGTVYELSPKRTETVLYTFEEGADGYDPQALVRDKDGNLWGTAFSGGNQNGDGLIFKVNRQGVESTVHTFLGSPSDGCRPSAALISDRDGKFYGTTFGCGKYPYGTVFELAPDGSETLLHSFRGGHDGIYPLGGLTIDPQGNLYGTTEQGGNTQINCDDFSGCGTVFKLTTSGTKTLLYEFNGSPKDGERITGNVIIDASGTLYGTSNGGGRAGCAADEGCGIVFKLAPDGKETVLHFFEGESRDGGNPPAGMIADGAGNMYGTTEYGGGRNPCNGADGCGTFFEITPDGSYTVLHKFTKSIDGANPPAGLVMDGAGHLYGTTMFGGAYGYGTVFEITP